MMADPEKTYTEENKVWQDAPLPQEYCGMWQRLSIAFPDGSEDADTKVFWIQTPTHHIDLRIPGDRSEMCNVNGFDGLALAQFEDLARQEGFAGHNQFQTGAIAWRRDIDFNPPAGPPDEGRMIETAPDLYEERGIHADYTEIWRRVAPQSGPFAQEISDKVMLLRAGDWVAYICDHRPAVPPVGKLQDLVREAARAGDRTALAALLDCEISFGRITGADRATIEFSSHPWREGKQLPKI